MTITKTIKLKAWGRNYVRLVTTQGEMKSRTLSVKLEDEPNLTGCAARVYITEASGRKIFVDGEINENIITGTIPLITSAGDAEVQIVITRGEECLKITGLTLDVRPSDLDDAISTDDDWSALLVLVGDTKQYAVRAENAAGVAVRAAQEAKDVKAYTKGESDARYLRASLAEKSIAGAAIALPDADDASVYSLTIYGTTAGSKPATVTATGETTKSLPLASPLWAVGSTKDVYDIASGTETRKIGERTVIGANLFDWGDADLNAYPAKDGPGLEMVNGHIRSRTNTYTGEANGIPLPSLTAGKYYFKCKIQGQASSTPKRASISLYMYDGQQMQFRGGASQQIGAMDTTIYDCAFATTPDAGGQLYLGISLFDDTMANDYIDVWDIMVSRQDIPYEPYTETTEHYVMDAPAIKQLGAITVPTKSSGTTITFDKSVSGTVVYPLSAAAQWESKQDKSVALADKAGQDARLTKLETDATLHSARLDTLDADVQRLGDDKADRGDAYTKGASDSRYLRSTVVEEPMTGGTAVLADADDGALASLRIEGVTRETGSGDKGPENPYTLSGVSPSIVRASGKNLFDNSGGWNPMTSGNDTVSNTSSGCQISSVAGGFGASTAALFPVTPGQTYTISGRWEQTTDYIAPVNGLRLNFYRTAERVDAQPGTQWKYTQKQQDISGTDTVPDGCYYAAINFYTGFSATQPVDGTLSNVQLEFGTAPTAYEPYRGKTIALPALTPLYGNGKTSDEYDLVTGAETRRWKRVELDGTESWGLSNTASGNNRYYLRAPDSVSQTSASQIVCSHWPSLGPGQTWEDKTGITLALGTTDKCIYLYDPRFAQADLPAFKSFLSAQYAAGTPVTVLYQLAEPVMTQHDPLTVPTYRENTSLQLDASAPGLLRYPLSSVMQWDAKQDKAAALRRYAPALTGEASGAVAAVSDAAAGFLMQRAAATGVTIETGTGGKAPENPYALSGAEPSKVVACGKNLLGFEYYAYSTNTTSRVYTGNEIVIKNIHTSAVSTSVILDGQAIGSLFTGTFGAGTYTFSVQFEGAATLTAPRLQLAYSDGTLVTCNSGQPVTLTHPAAITGIRCNPTEVASGVSVTMRLQFEKGPTATEIEPYTGAVYPLPTLAPFYSVGDVCDEYDAVSGVETRRIGVKVLDGTETWSVGTNGIKTNTIRMAASVPLPGDRETMCSHFVQNTNISSPLTIDTDWYIYNLAGWALAINVSKTVIGFADGDSNSQIATKFKSWLKAEKESGTPVTLVYTLNTPVITQHDPQDITQPEAAMSVLADGGAEMDIRYSRDLNIALLDQIEYATALEARIAQLEILTNPQ